ncbi:response regulator transcription factor [Kitasatospora sp. NPDC058218]|uniref:response regulator transcription factor n=1 Tax=Kitasatospora sp. NPDC058218 TaxID=3346385 RepID=UPI0036DAF598
MEILVVEDDPQVAAAVRRGLEAEGYTVDLAPDGLTGLRLAQRHAYRAIVLDIMLPGLNGYKVCEALREGGSTTPILMLTAKDGEYDEAEGLDTGADDYLTKPFSYLVFLARLRALLRRSATPGALLRVGGLWMDPAARRCGRDNAEITLTEREFAVLRFLAEHPGEVLSKRRIVDEVWDIAFDGEESIVEVYISMLRRKVDTPFGLRSITTVRGAGYRLEP